MYDNNEIYDEEEFAWQFKKVSDLTEYLELQYAEDVFENVHLVIDDLAQIKQAFLNQERHFYYMECVRFEETYLQ